MRKVKCSTTSVREAHAVHIWPKHLVMALCVQGYDAEVIEVQPADTQVNCARCLDSLRDMTAGMIDPDWVDTSPVHTPEVRWTLAPSVGS